VHHHAIPILDLAVAAALAEESDSVIDEEQRFIMRAHFTRLNAQACMHGS
jgi:hypothetical protein